MNELKGMMQDILQGLAARQGSQTPGAPRTSDDPRKGELNELLKVLPRLPPGWKTLLHPRIDAAISEWAWGAGNLLLLGDTGCGKTLGATALATRLLTSACDGRQWARARRIVFVEAARLALAREQYGLGNGEAPLVERCMRTPLLFIDELGYLDKETGVLEHVIDVRNKLQLPVVVTSGMEPKELHSRYGAATARKMMATGRRDMIVQVFAS